ncbi:MAG: hypothetical protein V9G25_08320 [Acidimicrobiia bacterium]
MLLPVARSIAGNRLDSIFHLKRRVEAGRLPGFTFPPELLTKATGQTSSYWKDPPVQPYHDDIRGELGDLDGILNIPNIERTYGRSFDGDGESGWVRFSSQYIKPYIGSINVMTQPEPAQSMNLGMGGM